MIKSLKPRPLGRICDSGHPLGVILSEGAQRRSRNIWAQSRGSACGTGLRSLDPPSRKAPAGRQGSGWQSCRTTAFFCRHAPNRRCAPPAGRSGCSLGNWRL